jgi:hypothetical protein
MVGLGGTNIAVRTTIMISALVVLLLMALLPGPLRWLVGASRGGGLEPEPLRSRAEGAASSLEADGGGSTAIPRPEYGAQLQDLDVEPAVDGGTPEPAGIAPSERGPATVALAAPGVPAEHCAEISSQLCRLGAAYFRLESWADEPQVFRFQCTLPLNDSRAPEAEGYRTFEASAADPATAMRQVLADVQAWQTTKRY